MSEQSNENEKKALQQRIDSIIRELNRDSDEVFAPYITYSDSVQSAVSTTRKELGLEKSTIPKNDQPQWAKINSKLLLKGFTYSKLPTEWYTFFVQYVATNSPPSIADTIEHPRFIEIIDNDANGITLKINKGIRYEEFLNGWNALSEHLGKGRRKNKLPNESTRIRDLQMHGKKEMGYTQKQLAEEYFQTDVEYSKDAVKKALKRQKQLFDEGTDLAK